MIKISPSLMCADQLDMMKSIISLIKLDVDMLHFDIMDGNFVRNLALNLNIIKQARPLTRIPFDVHLMVKEPSRYFDELIDYGTDIIIFHVETVEDVEKNLKYLKLKGIKVGLALHLTSPPKLLDKYLPMLDYILIMTVKTGYSGLKFDDSSYQKVNYVYSRIKNKNYPIEIMADGGVGLEHVQKLYESGTDIVVAGTSILFNKKGFGKNLEKFRNLSLPKRTIQKITEPVEIIYNSAVLNGVKDFSLKTKKLRQLKKNEVLIKVMSCGICGSDLIRVFQKGMYSNGLVPGHEISGIVIKSTDENLMNKRVAVYPLVPCRECNLCLDNKHNLCLNYDYLGSRSDGGFSQLLIAPKSNVVVLPNNVSYDEGALIEPMAVALRGLNKLKILGSNCLILGLGPIGILAGVLAKKLGCNKVFGVDRNSHKRDIAEQVGFDGVLPQKSNEHINLLIECSGSSSLLNQYIPLLQKESSILLLGNHEKDLKLEPGTISSILRGELTIFSSWNSQINEPFGNEWATCINFIANQNLNITPLITHTFPLQKIVDVFSKMKNKELKYLKIIINPN